ncbi:hypothetical protein G3O00_21465 [Burkholderia sp. Ac-20384]|uniref:hypothetical protein n=1 Tax=Burkholderia TaxID=32008 RepID=UPI0014534EB3|nr:MULTISPECIES: hypothetical protein [Burkholderia]MBN3826177.1 hypothetical protein [Burkholderia sp. Ac-20384]VWB11709.1 hypothetical protein BLA6993_00380 [Burkholderia lata]
MRIASSTATPALQPSAYALSDVGACTWCLLPPDTSPAVSGAGHAHAFDAHPIFRCRLTGRYTSGLSLNVVCGNGYATVHQLAQSHVDTVSRLLVRDEQNDAGHRVHAFDDGIAWQ